jgi:hypothetical protein
VHLNDMHLADEATLMPARWRVDVLQIAWQMWMMPVCCDSSDADCCLHHMSCEPSIQASVASALCLYER